MRSTVYEGLSFSADIDVIDSIVLLGLDMQQNRKMMQSLSKNSILEHYIFLCDKMIENPKL